MIAIKVASSDDLVDFYGRYIELVATGNQETLDIELAPGVYGVASIGPISLDLGGNPAPRDPRIDVVLRGASTNPPVVLRDLGILVNARSLVLENLVLTGRLQAMLNCRVATSFRMRNCVVATNTWGGPWAGVLMQVCGIADRPAYEVEISDCWFLRNEEQSPSAVLAIRPATESFVERVEVTRVGFLHNGNQHDLIIDEARSIHLDGVIAIKDVPDAAVMQYRRSDRVVIERSTFVVPNARSVAREDTRTWVSGIDIRDSTLYTGSEGGPLAATRNVTVRDRASLRSHTGAYDSLLAAITRRVPDVGAARAQLADALGLEC